MLYSGAKGTMTPNIYLRATSQAKYVAPEHAPRCYALLPKLRRALGEHGVRPMNQCQTMTTWGRFMTRPGTSSLFNIPFTTLDRTGKIGLMLSKFGLKELPLPSMRSLISIRFG